MALGCEVRKERDATGGNDSQKISSLFVLDLNYFNFGVKLDLSRSKSIYLLNLQYSRSIMISRVFEFRVSMY